MLDYDHRLAYRLHSLLGEPQTHRRLYFSLTQLSASEFLVRVDQHECTARNQRLPERIAGRTVTRRFVCSGGHVEPYMADQAQVKESAQHAYYRITSSESGMLVTRMKTALITYGRNAVVMALEDAFSDHEQIVSERAQVRLNQVLARRRRVPWSEALEYFHAIRSGLCPNTKLLQFHFPLGDSRALAA